MPALFSAEDFSHYFGGCVVRNPSNPSNLLRTIAGSGQRNTIDFQDALDSLQESPPVRIKVEAFDWNHLQIPRLGYVPYKGFPVYVKRVVRRDAKKGYCQATASINFPENLLHSLEAAGIDYNNPLRGVTVMSKELVSALFNGRDSVDVVTAVEILSTKPKAYGIALDLDFAITLGASKEEAFSLLWRERVLANSPDGAHWNFISPEYETLARRKLQISSGGR